MKCIIDLKNICNQRPFIKLCANGRNNSQHVGPTMLWVVASICTWLKVWPVQPLRNNSQQHATTCNRVCKRTQYVTSNNVGVVGQQCYVCLYGALTLLDVTCCVRLHTLLRVVGCCCVLLRKVWNRSQAAYKRAHHCWPITPNIVGCCMLHLFAHPIACWRKVWNRSYF